VVRLMMSFGEMENMADKVKVVVNRVGLEQGHITLKKAEETIGKPIFWQLPNDYRTMIEVAQKSGDPERVLKSLDGLASVPGARGEALVKRGEFLESAGRQVDAERTWEEALRLGDPAAASAAALRLAQAAERGKDALRAQTLYEGILRESTGAPEALPARLGLAALYRAAGRASEARRLYEDLVRLAPPGGEFARAAEAALREMDGMAPAAAEAKP